LFTFAVLLNQTFLNPNYLKMKTISMSGSLRGNVGKKSAKQVRKDGMVPAALYGGEKQILISINEKQLQKAIFTPHVYLINLDIEGTAKQVIVKDIQFHPVTDSVLHVDLLEVLPEKPIMVSLPLKFEGSSVGVLKGGKLVKKYRSLKVKGLAAHIPENIVISINELDINSAVKVEDIQRDHLTLLDPPSSVVVTVVSTRAAVVAEETPAKK
jgi:large subunit ribosomal protein L25